MQNGVDELKKSDAALLTVLLPPPAPPPPLLIPLQTCIGLLAYPDPARAPPEAQLLLQPSFKHHTASLVNLALIQTSHPAGGAAALSSSPIADALAATLALQKLHLDACGGRGLAFDFRVLSELEFSELLVQQHRRQEQRQGNASGHSQSVALPAQQEQQSHLPAFDGGGMWASRASGYDDAEVD
jgi:hypothetical protein